ncbi:MAG: hypothetical protein DRO99_01635 [Candidatus Aenigmatarchaeota archaeon]|nr:MAG: hypothetical protein DRO99_01635 [Candidatus Aenigmarchaeota archaeon]
MPLPHRVTIKRPKWSDTRHEQYRGEETVATNVKALISPADRSVRALENWGGVELLRDTVFLEPGIDVRRGDVIIDNASGDRWRVIEPPKVLQNPITWEDDHIECTVEKEVIGQW